MCSAGGHGEGVGDSWSMADSGKRTGSRTRRGAGGEQEGAADV